MEIVIPSWSLSLEPYESNMLIINWLVCFIWMYQVYNWYMPTQSDPANIYVHYIGFLGFCILIFHSNQIQPLFMQISPINIIFIISTSYCLKALWEYAWTCIKIFKKTCTVNHLIELKGVPFINHVLLLWVLYWSLIDIYYVRRMFTMYKGD